MRQPLSAIQWALCGFQSTHPLRDATNPLGVESFFVSISIHAPLTGCDADDATHRLVTDISIHAPLTGCDQQQILFIYAKADFNPRTPYGMRHGATGAFPHTGTFQSTHPLRDATAISLPF